MNKPKQAMVAAAGLGSRMRPLTNDKPKALVRLAGKTLIDHQLDRLAASGVQKAVVNVHHFAEQLQSHLQTRAGLPQICISNEREQLLETGGGLLKASKHLDQKPFFVMNVDAVWSGHETALDELAQSMAKQDDALAVLLLAKKDQSLGLNTAGDFHMDKAGRLRRLEPGETSNWYYAGVQIFDPALMQGFKVERFSTNLFWDLALTQNRLFGLELQGFWMHVGDPKSLQQAEIKLRDASK